MYRKSNTGAVFQVKLKQVNVGWKKRSVSTNGWSRQIGGYTLRALSTLHFWFRLVRLMLMKSAGLPRRFAPDGTDQASKLASRRLSQWPPFWLRLVRLKL